MPRPGYSPADTYYDEPEPRIDTCDHGKFCVCDDVVDRLMEGRGDCG